MRFSFLCCFLLFSAVAFGQSLIVTAEGHNGAAPPGVDRDAIAVDIDKKPATIQQWVPLVGEQTALQLYIVIDDGLNPDVGVQFDDLKKFINAQPPTTEIGLAYLRYGSGEILVPMTVDHAAVSGKLRIPLGQPGISASPYMGIPDLIKKWPAAPARREILMISSGIDPWSSPNPQDPYLLSAIADAQRAAIPVHSIYYGESGHLGHSFWRVNSGQNFLSELGDETGGEAYGYGIGSPVSFAPFLKDFDQRLRNQYLLTIAASGGKPELQSVRVTTSIKGVSLTSASEVNLPH